MRWACAEEWAVASTALTVVQSSQQRQEEGITVIIISILFMGEVRFAQENPASSGRAGLLMRGPGS